MTRNVADRKFHSQFILEANQTVQMRDSTIAYQHCKRTFPMAFTVPDLTYGYEELQPFMSRETLEYHHDKHHLAYVTNSNNLLKDYDHEGQSIEKIIKGSFGKNPGVFNNVAQHYNHTLFWASMKPNGGGKIPGDLEKAIVGAFGSLERMKKEFIQAGVAQFGSGWHWLVVRYGKIEIMATPNGENPLVHGATPILGNDVWEHSYYIDYRNRRPDYCKAFIENLVNWDAVAERYDAAMNPESRLQK